MFKTADGWVSEYQKRGALWLHDGNSRRPHALLSSKKHSDGFFNSELVMEDPCLLDEASQDLVELLMMHGLNINGVDRVVGPAMGAITLAHDIARHISRKRSRSCLRAYTEKELMGNGSTLMVFKRANLHPTELVLMVEDVLTTGGSVELTSAAVAVWLGYIVPFVAVLVNRSSLTAVNGKKIVALIDCPMSTWMPDECPLCRERSEAIHPKGRENWARLNASY
jgi:orotate phosphoribosyltransferase